MTKSPFFNVDTSRPVSSTTPTNSWPIGEPPGVAGMLWYGCRSEPQTHALTTRTIASVGCCSAGSGTVSTRTSPAQYMMVARMVSPLASGVACFEVDVSAWTGRLQSVNAAPRGRGSVCCSR